MQKWNYIKLVKKARLFEMCNLRHFLVAFVNYLAIRMVFVTKAKPYSSDQCLMKNKMKERDRVFADSVINFSDIFDSMFNLLQWYMRKLETSIHVPNFHWNQK